MKIAIVGAAGQLAADMILQLSTHDLLIWSREDLDITDANAVQTELAATKPHAVVNCAAYNLVDRAESEIDQAFLVNAYGARNLALACELLGCTLLHFSTDYVFGLDADRRTPWQTTDAPGPVSVYGASKLAGEHFVRACCQRHFVVRTCGLYGHKGARGKGGNFVETMLKLAAKGGPLRVVADQVCTPSFTADVAKAASELLKSTVYGLYHVTNSGGCSWHELACETFRLANLRVDCQPIASHEWPCAARRPAYSVLSNHSLANLGIDQPPPWQDALSRYISGRKDPSKETK